MEGGEHADLRAAPKAGRGRGIDVGSMNAFEDACIGHSPEQATVYAKACAAAASSVSRVVHDTDTSLSELARNSNLARQERRSAGDSGSASATQYYLHPNGRCINLNGVDYEAGVLKGSLRPVDQYHRVSKPGDEQEFNDADLSKSAEVETAAREQDRAHEQNVTKADAYWAAKAREKDWDCVRADLSVYRYCGREIAEDPRRTPEYRKKVIDGLGFGEGSSKPSLAEKDMAACREVLNRKAAAFWIDEEDNPRTALRYLLHDTIPTGPPCRTPPHRLKGEEAEWVDSQLQKEVVSGQLIRGNSEWASPPFATKEFAEHRRQRKRRVVVDYRRVNARILRAVYFVRSADGVVQEVAGSMWMSLVDACKGFNQVANTRRAREVLAILARSGQHLPVFLTLQDACSL